MPGQPEDEHDEHENAGLVDPPFPIICPKCSEPMLVHATTATCFAQCCPGQTFMWADGEWAEDEFAAEMSDEQLQALENAAQEMGGY